MNFFLVLLLAADLASVKTMPDLEKRSQAAIANAEEDIDLARSAYSAGDVNKMRQILQDLSDSVDVAKDSLEGSRRQARRSKYYKNAELKTRAMTRRLSTLSTDVSVTDRPPVEAARQKVMEVHDQLLQAIMSNKK